MRDEEDLRELDDDEEVALGEGNSGLVRNNPVLSLNSSE